MKTRRERLSHDEPFIPAALMGLFADEGGEGEGGGAGAGADGGGAADGADAGAGADGASGDGGSGEGDKTGAADGADGEGSDAKPKRYEPEGVDPAELGETDQETIDKLAKRNKGLREELSKKPGAPKSVEEYPAIEFDEEYRSAFGNPDDDKAIGLVRDKAFKYAIPPDAYKGFVKEVMQDAAEQGLLDRPLDFAAEIEAVGGKEVFDRQATDFAARIDGMAAQGRFSEKAAAELKPLLVTSGGHEALKSIFGLLSEKGVQVDPGKPAGGGELSDLAAVKKAMTDPRYDSKNRSKFDPEFVKKVDEAYTRLSQKA